MFEAMKTFQMVIKEQGHVLPLIDHADLRVAIHCEQQTLELVIKGGEISIHHDLEETQAKSQIRGDLLALKLLFEGKERLRVLEHKGQLRVSAPLRTILLLESMFYLTRAQAHPLAKKLIKGIDSELIFM